MEMWGGVRCGLEATGPACGDEDRALRLWVREIKVKTELWDLET